MGALDERYIPMMDILGLCSVWLYLDKKKKTLYNILFHIIVDGLYTELQ